MGNKSNSLQLTENSYLARVVWTVFLSFLKKKALVILKNSPSRKLKLKTLYAGFHCSLYILYDSLIFKLCPPSNCLKKYSNRKKCWPFKVDAFFMGHPVFHATNSFPFCIIHGNGKYLPTLTGSVPGCMWKLPKIRWKKRKSRTSRLELKFEL